MNQTRMYRQVLWIVSGLVFLFSLQLQISAAKKEVKPLYEIPAMRNEYCQGFQNSDGSVSMVISSTPSHFQDGTGKWREINTALEDSNQEADEDGQKYGFCNISNTLESYLPQNNNGWVQLRSGKTRLSFRLVNNNKTTFQKEDRDTITGHDILPMCDVSLAVKNAALKEDLILRDRTAPKQFEYQMILHNLEATKTEDGAILFKDKQDKPVFIMPKMVMYDSNQAISEEIETILTRQGDKYRLTVKPNLQWLMDPGRKYPITIDPTTIRITGAGSDPSQGVGTLVYYLPGIDFINATTSQLTYSKTLSSSTFYINNYSDVRANYFPFDVSYTVTATSEGTSAQYWSSSSGAAFRIDAWDPAATSNSTPILGNIYSYGFSNGGGTITKTFTLQKGAAVRFEINNVDLYRAFGLNPWSCGCSMTITCQRESMSPEPPVLTQLAPETYERTATLNWTAPVDNINIDPSTGQPYPNTYSAGIQEYVLQRSTSSDFTQNITEIHVTAPATSYTFTDLSDGATYFFRCYAVDGDGNPTEKKYPWDPVSYPSGIRWSAITKTQCMAAAMKPLDPNAPLLTNINPAGRSQSEYFSASRNPELSFTLPTPTAQPFVKVAAGWYHSLALNANGTLLSWGANTYGQLGDGSTTVQKFHLWVKTSNGQPLTNVTAIACGQYHSLALKSDGTVWA